MHVTTYATTQTATTRLNFIQVMNDPYFVGNYNCNGTPMDRPFEDGNLQYCNVTPNGALFNWLTDNTVSLNHVEVATDQIIVDNNPMEHDRMIINQFDSEYEFSYIRSRFAYLCRNVQQTITVTEPILLTNTFWRSPGLPARFVSCYGPIANTGNGLWHDPGMFQGWWIGTFFIVKNQNLLPTTPCLKGYNPFALGVAAGEYAGCAGYTQSQLVEVTVMTRRQFAQPAQFARWAQDLTLNSISQFMPFY